jgi:glycosyltransferase involved in cell wall biosynthesis
MVTYSVYERDTRVRRYAEYLAFDGHHVDVVSLNPEHDEVLAARENVHVYPIPMTKARREGFVQIVRWLVAACLMFFYVTILDVRRRYDVVHIHNMPDILVFCALIPRARGCPVLLNIHDPVPEVTRSKLGVAPEHPLVRVQVWLERICIRFSTHVLTATRIFKEILVSRGVPANKITVITNAADRRFFQPPATNGRAETKKDGFALLYVGTVAPRYGLDVAVRALPLLKDRIPGLKLIVIPKIVKEGAGLDMSLKLAKELGVADLVQVEKPVPLEEMPRLMREADIGLYPARQDCHMDIALSLKIPEMAAVGLCIVSSRLRVLEELYGADAIAFVPPGDHEALAQKIFDLYSSPDMRKNLAATAMERNRDLLWDKEYETYRNLLLRLVG